MINYVKECPECCSDTEVIYSGTRHDGVLVRRRECKKCKYRFNTYEVTEEYLKYIERKKLGINPEKVLEKMTDIYKKEFKI